jgi:hypothetical protein
MSITNQTKLDSIALVPMTLQPGLPPNILTPWNLIKPLGTECPRRTANTAEPTTCVSIARNQATSSTTARKKLLPISELQAVGHAVTSSITVAVQTLVLAVYTADVV